VDTFEGHGDEDDEEDDEEAKEHGYDELAESQLQDAPSTQPTQVVGTRRHRPPCMYTLGTDALGHKGKGKTSKHCGLMVDFVVGFYSRCYYGLLWTSWTFILNYYVLYGLLLWTVWTTMGFLYYN